MVWLFEENNTPSNSACQICAPLAAAYFGHSDKHSIHIYLFNYVSLPDYYTVHNVVNFVLYMWLTVFLQSNTVYVDHSFHSPIAQMYYINVNREMCPNSQFTAHYMQIL